MVKVSVVIAVYNGEPYLRECLNSILSQTLGDIEIICINDASTDNTLEILNEYANRIIIMSNEHNLMAGESRNRGLVKAQGEYIIFLDADDVFESDMLKKAYEKAHSANAEVCIFKEDLFSNESELCTGYPYVENLMDFLGNKMYFSPIEIADMIFNLWNGWAWDKIFLRQFLNENKLKFSNIKTSEDGFLVHAALASAKRIAFVNEILIHHRIGNTNSLSNSRNTSWSSCFIYLRELKRHLICNGLWELYERSFINWACEFLYWNYQTVQKNLHELFILELQIYILNELNISKYKDTYFYNTFSSRFVQCVLSGDKNYIPISERDKFSVTYEFNERKIEVLRQYFTKNKWKIALLGAGIRGQAFMEVYGAKWNNINCVFDMDERKQGKDLYPSIEVKKFEMDQTGNINCILVLNATHIPSVRELLKGKSIAIFDLNSYLTLPRDIMECFI